MLHLILHAGGHRFALDANQVVELLPLVRIEKPPHLSAAYAGLNNYRGSLLPVLDLCALTGGLAAPQRLSTRIVLVRQAGGPAGHAVAGLMVERATETQNREASDFAPQGGRPTTSAVNFLEGTITDEKGLLHRLNLAALWASVAKPAGVAGETGRTTWDMLNLKSC